jgi:hypothetical protein
MLIVVDSPRKITTLKPWFSKDKLISVEFPLYTRFKRGRIRVDTWPDLKVFSRPEITQVQKSAVGSDVLCILDDTAYGRVQARDLALALADLNNTVSFKFVKAYTREAIESAAAVADVPEDCDIRYTVNRIVSARVEELLEAYCGDDSSMSLTWQQAHVLGAIRRASSGSPKLIDVFQDQAQRVYKGTFDESAEPAVSGLKITFRPVRKSVLDLATEDIDFDILYQALDRLRASGYIAVSEGLFESPVFDDIAEEVRTHLLSLNVDGLAEPVVPGFFVTNLARDIAKVPESDLVRKVYHMIWNDTLLGCCGPVCVDAVRACISGLETLYACPERQTWLAISGVVVSSEALPASLPAAAVRRQLEIPCATNRTLAVAASEAGFTSRDLWSACSYLLRKKFVLRQQGRWYLTSRACMSLHVLEHTFPDAINGRLSGHVQRLTDFHNRSTNNSESVRNLETMSEIKNYLSENSNTVDANDMWIALAGNAEPHVSANAAWVEETGAARGIVFDGATDEFQLVSPDQKVLDPCPKCEADLVNKGSIAGIREYVVSTELSPTYETTTRCASCGGVRPLLGILERT